VVAAAALAEVAVVGEEEVAAAEPASAPGWAQVLVQVLVQALAQGGEQGPGRESVQAPASVPGAAHLDCRLRHNLRSSQWRQKAPPHAINYRSERTCFYSYCLRKCQQIWSASEPSSGKPANPLPWGNDSA
jgi:hypothetical protein